MSTGNQRRDGNDGGAFGDDRDRIRRLNLNLLYPLAAILRASSLTQAGALISLSQPAMSSALRKLREHFADELVVYGNHGRRLTPFAIGLEPRVARLLRAAEAAFTTDPTFDPATTRRTVRFAAPEAIEIMFLNRLAPLLLRAAPRLDIAFLPFAFGSSDALFDRGIDLACVPATMLDPACRSAFLIETSLCCLVCERSEITDGNLTVDAYRRADHIALLPGMERMQMMGDPMHPLTTDRRIVARTGRYSGIANLLRDTDCIATLNGWLAQHLAYHYPVRAVTLPFSIRPVGMHMQWEAHRDDDPLIGWIMRHAMALRDRMFECVASPDTAHHENG